MMANIEKVGVMWHKEFNNKKCGFKISLNKEIFVAFKNTKKETSGKATDPDYILVRFVDSENNKHSKLIK